MDATVGGSGVGAVQVLASVVATWMVLACVCGQGVHVEGNVSWG